MYLSWHEIHIRVAKFVEKWRGTGNEKGDSRNFYRDFFSIFGVSSGRVVQYEEYAVNHFVCIDLFWPGVLIAAQKKEGQSLRQQAGEYFDGLPENQHPRYLLVNDVPIFTLYDFNEQEEVSFPITELQSNVEAFGFIIDAQRDKASMQAFELIGHLHDRLNAVGYQGQNIDRLLMRTVFCLFADNAGIFNPQGLFYDFIQKRTDEDGGDLGLWLAHLFQTLATPEKQRSSTLDKDLMQFPYVGGRLFQKNQYIPSFNSELRQILLDMCMYDWSGISPAIFGTLFQSVMDPGERRIWGVHYTTERNILKVIAPLFLDDLHEEFDRLRSRGIAELVRFQERLARLRFLDPACGCGNFLVIAYRELRLLEIEVLKEIHSKSRVRGQIKADVSVRSLVKVTQFYGIEISEFPTHIAETALWITDYIMNTQFSMEFGQTTSWTPLATFPIIVHGDALEMDWSDVLTASDGSFVFGNPPFVGAKIQNRHQRSQVHKIAELGSSGGTLDYVTAWFIKAGEYIGSGGGGRIGFVSTNSIVQGEQVGQFWPILFERCKLEIVFAHRTFVWGSDARGEAQVHVVIVGLDHQVRAGGRKRLFSYPDRNGEPLESQVPVLSPYLFYPKGLKNFRLTVREETRPINGMKKMISGSQPIDGKHYIFNREERDAFLAREPGACPFLRPFVGAREFLQGRQRWILALHDVHPNVLERLPKVLARMDSVRAYRELSERVSTKKLARTPALYQVNIIPTAPFLVIPETSSDYRHYIPIGWMNPPAIPSNSLKVLLHATLTDFALLTSSMHMAWMRVVAGRLGSGYRYSVGVVYNTFPVPSEGVNMTSLEPLAQEVLNARTAHSESTLASLYAPDHMPPDLRHAHRALDCAVDTLYRPESFDSEQDRIEHLFVLYEKMQ